ncbi:hypothetical protein Ahy_A03g011911 isoform E [Arachis hypogaea]|uniref:Secreted protein n=1 Tax=Arachis hypogaea TaxID=3818 RepID=A0A445DS32_ARAHY|nr:hypothetical protein Ahy_A03g011911 isoform E [Arachis hypogaea]
MQFRVLGTIACCLVLEHSAPLVTERDTALGLVFKKTFILEIKFLNPSHLGSIMNWNNNEEGRHILFSQSTYKPDQRSNTIFYV